MADDWQEVVSDEAEKLLKQYAVKADYPALLKKEKHLEALELSFYQNYRLYRATIWEREHFVMPRELHFFVGNGDMVFPDGTPGPIYDLNRRAPLILTTDNVGDYVRWFHQFYFVPDCQFIETADALSWATAPAGQRKEFEKLVHSPRFIEQDPDGGYIVQITLFKSEDLPVPETLSFPLPELVKRSLRQCLIIVDPQGNMYWVPESETVLMDNVKAVEDNYL